QIHCLLQRILRRLTLSLNRGLRFFLHARLFSTHHAPRSKSLRQLADKSEPRSDRSREDFVKSNKREIRREQQTACRNRDQQHSGTNVTESTRKSLRDDSAQQSTRLHTRIKQWPQM